MDAIVDSSCTTNILAIIGDFQQSRFLALYLCRPYDLVLPIVQSTVYLFALFYVHLTNPQHRLLSQLDNTIIIEIFHVGYSFILISHQLDLELIHVVIIHAFKSYFLVLIVLTVHSVSRFDVYNRCEHFIPFLNHFTNIDHSYKVIIQIENELFKFNIQTHILKFEWQLYFVLLNETFIPVIYLLQILVITL